MWLSPGDGKLDYLTNARHAVRSPVPQEDAMNHVAHAHRPGMDETSTTTGPHPPREIHLRSPKGTHGTDVRIK